MFTVYVTEPKDSTLRVYRYKHWWRNFLQHCFDKHQEDYDIGMPDINRALEEWKAVYNENTRFGDLMFEKEKDAVLFLLRWS